MQKSAATKIVRASFLALDWDTAITREARKELNPALFALFGVTLGGAHTWAEFRKAQPKVVHVIASETAWVNLVPAKPASTGFVRAQIREAAARKAALAELASINA